MTHDDQKQALFNALAEALDLPATEGQMGDLVAALEAQGLKLVPTKEAGIIEGYSAGLNIARYAAEGGCVHPQTDTRRVTMVQQNTDEDFHVRMTAIETALPDWGETCLTLRDNYDALQAELAAAQAEIARLPSAHP